MRGFEAILARTTRPHGDDCDHCKRARINHVTSFCVMPAQHREAIEAKLSSGGVPRRYHRGELFLVERRAWWEHYARRGMRWKRGAFYRNPIPPRVRAAVLQRDGLVCQICGGAVDRDDVHLDHIVRYIDGGPDTVGNLRVTHSQCNLRRRA